MRWYVQRGGQEIGPLGDDALRALVQTGQVRADTLLWHEGLGSWSAAAALPELAGVKGRALPEHEATRWCRYWARTLDVLVSVALTAFLIGMERPSLFTQIRTLTGSPQLLGLILLPFGMIMDALIYRVFGNTPGKALAGLIVLDEESGEQLSLLAYLKRNFVLYAAGFALGLPPFSLIALLVCFGRAVPGAILVWDRVAHSRLYGRSEPGTRTALTAAAYGVATLGLVALHLQEAHGKARLESPPGPSPILEQELSQAADTVNDRAPRMVGGVTRLDGARAGPGLRITYRYTLTNLRLPAIAPANLETLRQRVRTRTRRYVCGATSAAAMLRNGTSVRFDYRDRDGQELETVSVTRADCGK